MYMYVMYVCIRPPPTLPGTEDKAKFLVKENSNRPQAADLHM